MKIDKSYLNFSDKTSLSGIEEVDINLKLSNVTTDNLGEIKGKVVDETGNPIENATVKIFKQDHTPFMHTVTDKDGEYSILGVPSDSYKINAVQTGYLYNPAVQVFVNKNDIVKSNFILSKDISAEKSTIAGLVYLEGTKTPISNVKLVVEDTSGKPVSVTYSAVDGEFLITNLDSGVYTVSALLSGYKTNIDYIYEVTDGNIYNVIIHMVNVQIDVKGTYTGQVLDQNNSPVISAIVGLYKIVDGEEKLILLSKTNTEGRYMFGNVEPGEYIVKAKSISTEAVSIIEETI